MFKIFVFPKLDNISPTMESTMIKLSEEVGELAAEVGKYRNMSGESNEKPPDEVYRRIVEELIDVMQAATSFMFVMEEKGFDSTVVDAMMQEHYAKMKKRGYMG